MRYALGLVIWLLAIGGLSAADQTKSKSTSTAPPPIQLGVLVGGKAWDVADLSPDKTDQSFQTAELHTPTIEPIIGVVLTNPNNYDLQYTCVYHDSLLGNDKTETVKAGLPCPNVPHNTQSLYVKSLSAEFTSQPKGKIKISCWLYDYKTQKTEQTNTDPLPTLGAPTPDQPTPCATTTADQKIVGIQIAIQPPPKPPVQLGILVSGKDWIMADSTADKTDKKFQTVEFHTDANEPIIGISLTNQGKDKDYDFAYTCTYGDNNSTQSAKSGMPCPQKGTGDAAATYVKKFSIAFASKSPPPGKIKISCTLYDTAAKTTTQTNTDPPPADPAISVTPCATTKDTQRIVGIQVAIPQPPEPLLQLGILPSGKAWKQDYSSPDSTDWNFQKIAIDSDANEPIIGFVLKNLNPKDDFQYTCTYQSSDDKKKPIKAGMFCLNLSRHPAPINITGLSIEDTAKSLSKFEISCRLFDYETNHDTKSAPCVTTSTQGIVGVTIRIQPPPP